MPADFDPKAVLCSPFAVGAAGALVASFKALPGTSWWERILNVTSGAVMAGYLSPALVEWLKMTTPAYSSGAAFAVGLLGMSLASAIIKAISETPFATIIQGWLTRR